jgi:hypothetical protein
VTGHDRHIDLRRSHPQGRRHAQAQRPAADDQHLLTLGVRAQNGMQRHAEWLDQHGRLIG